MDYVIKLAPPENGKPVFGDGARFEFAFDKVRAKKPRHDKFTALLRPDENGQLQLYYDTLESNLDDYFFVLRFLGEEGDVPQHEIAKHLNMSLGKVNSAIKRLSQHGLITNTNTCKLPTTYGKQTLHEIWPALFAEPAQAELTDEEKMPF